MSMHDCITAVIEAAGRDLSEAELDRIFSRVQGAARRYEAQGMNRLAAAQRAGTEVGNTIRAAAAIEKRNQLLNLQKRIDRSARLDQIAGQVARKDGLAAAIRAQIRAINTPVQGGRLSAEAFKNARRSEYAGGVVTALQKLGLLKAVRNGTIEAQWATELYHLSLKAAGDDRAAPGITGSPQARQIAEVFHRYQQLAKSRLNREGAWIGDYAGYITRTQHDQARIRRTGPDAWRAAIEPLLDERTFEDVPDRDKFFGSLYHALNTGVHLSDEGGVGLKDPAFAGPANLAAKASAERELHFKNADAWLSYQRQFGTGNLAEQMFRGFDRASQQEALLARWGTNPEAEFNRDIRRMEENYRDTQSDRVIALGNAKASLQAEFNMLTGETNRPGNITGARISSAIRTIESTAKLGMVAFTHVSSGVTKAGELRYQGVGAAERWGNFITSMLEGRGAGEMRELADLMHAGTEGMHGDILSRFAVDDGMPGRMSKIANGFFKWTGLTYLLDAQKAGAERIMSRHLGRLVDTGFEALPAETQRALMQYDIAPKEWDALRQAPDHYTTDDGRVFLTPDAATRSTAEMTDAARDNLALKLHAYYADVADRSVVTPGIATRALLVGGTQPGTLTGEALRFVWQFKTWGVAAVDQGLGREIYGGQGTAGAISGIMQMAVGATALGYATMVLKDAWKGQTPRSLADPRTYLAALTQGGGFGVLADYLFGEVGRFGGGVGETVLGPVLGQGMTELLTLYNHMKDAATSGDTTKMKDIPPELLRIGTNNTPFINLFYARVALNWLLLHSLQETLNPGYLRRTERSLKQRQGTTYFLAPSEHHFQAFGR